MKYIGAVAGTLKGTEHSVQFSVCCVLPATGEDLKVERGQVQKKLDNLKKTNSLSTFLIT